MSRPTAAVDDTSFPDTLDRHLRARLRATGHAVEIGPFLAGFDPDSVSPFRSFAVPDRGARPDQTDIAALVTQFRVRSRLPRVEYLPSNAPDVEGALAQAGFVVDLRPPVMACAVSVGRPVLGDVDGVRVAPVDAGEMVDVAGACVAAHLAFGEDGMPDDSDVARLARSLAGGGGAVLARTATDDEPVGTAQHLLPIDGVAEVVGVGVLEGYRRRGLAAVMVGRLLEVARQRGVTLAWLTPNDPASERVYARAGFRTVAEALHMSLPA